MPKLVTLSHSLLALLLFSALGACDEPSADPPAEPTQPGEVASSRGGASPTYEQSFVFASVSGDSVFLVPWLMRSTVHPDSVMREARGWLERSRVWDAFYAESWSTGPTRTPARILPFGNLRLLVQQGDVVDGIIFEDGARRLELAFDEVRATWGGPRGEAIAVVDGAAYLSDERVEGVIMHMARASSGGTPPGGDWALLVGDDSLVLVLAGDEEHGDDREPVYRGWAQLGTQERLWTDVSLGWDGTQAFPPARRDIPVSWRITSEGRLIEGNLEVVSADIQAGEGPGPLLPVRALYEVAGEVSLPEGEYVVRGLLVHERR